jgi:hypothetical protein
MKKLELRITADLPEDEFDRADALTKLREPMAAFRKAIEAAGLVHVHETKVFTAKAAKAAKEKKDNPTPAAQPAGHPQGSRRAAAE